MKIASVTLAAAFLLGCQRHSEQSTFVIHSKPPERKDIIEAIMASHSVPLSVSPTCASVGTQPDDKTIGGYLSGFLAALDGAEAKNWLETRVSESKNRCGSAVWRCELIIRHSSGEDEWG